MLFIRIPVLICTFLLANSNALLAQCVSSYPFSEDFESGPAGWTSGGANSDWTWGAPAKSLINAAGSGVNCWISGGLSNPVYNGGQKSWVESPCFDFGSLNAPYLTFLIFWDTERQYDGGNFQYSINGGTSWINLGSSGIANNCRIKNWFNASNINNLSGLASPQQGWSGSLNPGSGSCLGGNGSGQWLEAGYCLSALAGQPDVRFRFTFCSGTTCNNYDGMAFDAFTIVDLPIPNFSVTKECLTSTEVKFTATGGDCPSSWLWDFGDPASANNTASTSVATHDFSGSGRYVITLNVNEPCRANFSLQRIFEVPLISADISPVSCSGNSDGSIALDLSYITNPQLLWNTIPPSPFDSVFGLLPGPYTVTVNGDSSCQQDAVFLVGESSTPVRTQLPDAVIFCSGDELLLSPGNFATYLWSDGSTENTLSVSDTGTYAVTVTDSRGCSGTDSVNVRENCFTGIYVPGAFSPNNDGRNDFFRTYSAEVKNFRLTVFNRTSRVLFMSSDQEKGWDGKEDGEECPSGIYIWRVEYDGTDKKNRSEWGKVLLIR